LNYIQHNISIITKRNVCTVAQLSQRDRDAGWVRFSQQWKTGRERQYFADIIGLSSTTANYAAQGHLRSSKTVLIENPYATSL